ncbi:MAG: DUF2950 domain-containing protein [Gammaproteobacteria bacterium]|nr:DUF2950 domain-containing protein [Gammaproteobacteria bacterium]
MGSNTTRMVRWFGICSLVVLAAGCSSTMAQAPAAQSFATPEQAIEAMAALIGAHDAQAVERVFGPGSVDMFSSGDDDADQEDFQRVKGMIETRVEFSDIDDTTKVALIGDKAWPWPIPLVNEGEGWRFDTDRGREELLNRRVGRNELQTIAALHEVVDAQREYNSAGRDGQPPGYAQKFVSTEGKRDGLYWPPADGEELSPLGDLLADADVHAGVPQPFHGYYYRILKAQGPAAPGGKASYLDDNGLMTRGFAVIAWPAKYGNSGVMTFMINQRDIVFQKDLGPDTDAIAKAIDSFDPDPGWSPTGDAMLGAEDHDEAAATP